MINVLNMFLGIGIFAFGMVFPTLLEEFKNRKNKREPISNDVSKAFGDGFDAGYNEALFEIQHNEKKKDDTMPVERSYFVSEGFSEDDWINSSPTPPQADTDVSDAYSPDLYNVDVEIITDDREHELYKRASLGGI